MAERIPCGWWHRSLVRILCAQLPGTEALPGLDPARCAAFLTRYRAEAPGLTRLALHGCSLVFLLTPPVTGIGWRLATWLRAARLDAHADHLATHRWYPLRQAALMLQTVAGIAWAEDPAVRGALGLEARRP